MELSCDESVIKQMGSTIKKDYSSSLLSLSTDRRSIGGCPLAFGEGSTRNRIKNILKYRKPAFGILIVTAIIVGMICLGLASNPGTNAPEDSLSRIHNQVNDTSEQADEKIDLKSKDTIPTSSNTNEKSGATTQNAEHSVIHKDNRFEWIIRLSDFETTYFTPYVRYELVRVALDNAEELILDNCLWEITLEKPIVFTGERFVYTAAAEDTFLSTKEFCLISIRADKNVYRNFFQ